MMRIVRLSVVLSFVSVLWKAKEECFRYHHLYKLSVAERRHYKRMMQKTFLHMDIYSLAAVEKKSVFFFFHELY